MVTFWSRGHFQVAVGPGFISFGGGGHRLLRKGANFDRFQGMGPTPLKTNRETSKSVKTDLF